MTDENIEFDYEAEAEGGGSLEKATAKLRKLKAELEACKKERQEYLDGWQRLRADVANQKKDSAQLFGRATQSAREELLEDIIPALDAFDMAMGGSGWGEVDASWRSGVEYIYTQLLQALDKHGITSYGTAGEKFNAQEHEAAQEVADENKEAGVIIAIRRRGYKLGDRILRPAQVVVTA